MVRGEGMCLSSPGGPGGARGCQGVPGDARGVGVHTVTEDNNSKNTNYH